MAGVIIVISLMIFVVALYFRKIKSYLMQTDRLDFSLFLAGSSIYLGTFIFSPNWDYRLIFLIFFVCRSWKQSDFRWAAFSSF
jgi:hypothetical protein